MDSKKILLWSYSRFLDVVGTIFVSHSKNDIDIVNYFKGAFVRVGITAKFMELEDLRQKYPGVEISNSIRNECNAVAVLLGKKLAYPPYESKQYTHNWINFEVGVAIGSGKRVWVFERSDETIPFPIPFVTDYIRYDLSSTEHLRIIGEIVAANLFVRMYEGQPVQCPYRNCNASFNYWDKTEGAIYCPVCRRRITFGRPKKKKGVDTTFTYFPSNIRYLGFFKKFKGSKRFLRIQVQIFYILYPQLHIT